MTEPSTRQDAAVRAGEDVTALRGHLFATLKALQDKDNPMPVDRARAISEVSRTIIESARVEVEAARLAKRSTATPFLGNTLGLPAPAPGTPPVPNGISSITRHVLAGDDDDLDQGDRA